MIVITGDSWRKTRHTASTGLEFIFRRIHCLGLKVALNKTEALWLGRFKEKKPQWSHIMVEETQVKVKFQMKYLWLILDSKWGFKPHFEQLVVRLSNTVSSLSRIMSNLRGPCERVRRLFIKVIRSMAINGALVWCNAFVATSHNSQLLHKEQRKMAIRVARAYGTIPWRAACLLASSPSWIYVAQSLTDTYDWKEELTRGGKSVTRNGGGKEKVSKTRRVRTLAEQTAFCQGWPNGGQGSRARAERMGVKGPWRPLLPPDAGALRARLLRGVSASEGWEASTKCYYCLEEKDTAQHTLAECPA